MGKKPTPRTCVFCGGSPLTREHVLPQWLKPLVPFENKTGIGSGENRRTIPIPPSERVARAFCKNCNTGWMSDLEGIVQPILTPLILGDPEPRELGESELETIALWAAKTVIACQFVNPPDRRYVPVVACRWMGEHQSPPPGTRVWIAPHVGDVWAAFYALEPIGIWTVNQVPEVDEYGRLKVNSYTATLGLGHLLIHVLYFANVEIPVKDDPFAFQTRIKLIWPYLYDVTWPPGPPLSNTEASELAGVIPRGVPGVDAILDRPDGPPAP